MAEIQTRWAKAATQLIFYVNTYSTAGTGALVVPTIVVGDWQISKDGGAFINLSSLPIVAPGGSSQIQVMISNLEMTVNQGVTLRGIRSVGPAYADVIVQIWTTARGLDDLTVPTGPIGSVTGNVIGNVNGNVQGTVGSVVGSVGSVIGNVGGNVVGSVASVTTVTTVTNPVVASSVTGNVTGTVGSVIGNVGGSVGGNVTGNVLGTVASVVGNVGGDVVGNVSGHLVGDVFGNVQGTVASVVGAVASVTGNVGGMVGNITGTITGNLNGNVLGNVNGHVVGSVASVTGAVASVTGNVGGNVTGNVNGNLLGNVNGKVLGGGAGVITATGVQSQLAANSITPATFNNTRGAVVADAGNTVTSFKTTLAGSATNFYVRRILKFTSGANAGELAQVSAYVTVGGVMTVSGAFTSIPAGTDTFDLMSI